MRSQYDLETILKVDPIAIGTQVLRQRFGILNEEDAEFFGEAAHDGVQPSNYQISDKMALEAFKECVKKIEQVRHVSSPILKVITFQRAMDELMGLISEVGEIQDADVL